MARKHRFTEFLQPNVFYVLDYSLGETSMLAQLVQAGFRSISAPELTLETAEIKEGNWPFKRKLITGAAVNTLTLSKGVTFFDSDFWRWASRASVGAKTFGLDIGMLGLKSGFRKDLFLIQFLRGVPNAMKFFLPFGGWDRGLNVFPAKIWMLENTIPTRYKVGTDFDGSTGEISIAEIELSMENFDEIAIASL